MLVEHVLVVVLFHTAQGFVLSAGTSGSAHSPLAALYKVPTCGLQESCLFEVEGNRFEMCACPAGRSCNTEYSTNHQGIDYFFCEETVIPDCKDGDHSVTVANLQTTIHCTCKEPFVEKKIVSDDESTSEFVCKEAHLSQKMRKLLRGWKRRNTYRVHKHAYGRQQNHVKCKFDKDC